MDLDKCGNSASQFQPTGYYCDGILYGIFMEAYHVPLIALHFATLRVSQNSNDISIRKTLC